MLGNSILAAAAAAAIAGATQAQSTGNPPPVRNVVLVHGAFANGSAWRGVHDELTKRGYRVTIVQNPLTSLANDVEATRRVLDRQDGLTILVGHQVGSVRERVHRGGSTASTRALPVGPKAPAPDLLKPGLLNESATAGGMR